MPKSTEQTLEQKQLEDLVYQTQRVATGDLDNLILSLLVKHPSARPQWQDILINADPDETHYDLSAIHKAISSGKITPAAIISQIENYASQGGKSIRILAEIGIDLTKNNKFWPNGEMVEVHRYIERGILDRIERTFGVKTKTSHKFLMRQTTKDILKTLVKENTQYEGVYEELFSRGAW
jgi:hypothetical protein